MVASLRRGHLDLIAEATLQGLDHGTATVRIDRVDLAQVPVVRTTSEPPVSEVLGQRRRVIVGRELEISQSPAHLPVGGYPTEAQTAADRLRQRIDVDDVIGRARTQAGKSRSARIEEWKIN